MKLSDFDYPLPPELIAQYPEAERTSSRLLSLDKQTGDIRHLHFSDLLSLLRPHDLLVFNNTRVIPARLYGKKISGGKVEMLIERIVDDHTALAHIKSNKTIRLPLEVEFTATVKATVVERHHNLFKVRFSAPSPLLTVLQKIGHIPLPPYIDRADEQGDVSRYQTVYAKTPGAVAAPTAGLHFDETLLRTIQQNNIQCAYVTLHVGAGTFQPVKCDNILEHTMHSEWMEVDEACCHAIQQAKSQGGRVIAVGTTSVRCLETAGSRPYRGETRIFIYPGFQFQVIDGLITNFHVPCSTLLMLVSAFAGRTSVLNAYQQAIEQRYRFFSYGDAMVIL
ncbi:MAG: tRNA preQ1(34) S-adenosylmethionine ribosyltransferase-isomerase QueA [Gammaproteobacteria bacterium]|nr:tRNA preQ1(34) S-adenosylmethionine ribosyltransferase-isomerase QueA [Gammaproteobacteria bacterium]